MYDTIELFIEKVKTEEKIYLFGGGHSGKVVLRWLSINGHRDKIQEFVVSNKNDNPDLVFDIPVVEIDGMQDVKKGVLILAVVESSMPEILHLLKGAISIPVIPIKDKFIIEMTKDIQDFFLNGITAIADKYSERSEEYERELHQMYYLFGHQNMLGRKECFPTEKETDVMLISPPDWDFYAPYSAIPCLHGALKNEGIRVMPLDLGILAFHFRLQSNWKKYSKPFMSQKFFELRVKSNKENTYSTYEEYNNDMWFFHGRKFPFEKAKRLYGSMNAIQRGVLEEFYASIINRHTYINETDKFEYLHTVEEELEKFDGLYLIDTILKFHLLSLIIMPPPIVGFSVTGLAQFAPACMVAKMIKKCRPYTKVIFGGRGSAIMYEEKCKAFRESLFEIIDFLMIGEGETCLSKLCKALLGKGKQEISEIDNIIYRNEEGSIIEHSRYCENIEELPVPCFDDMNLSLYVLPETVYPYFTSKGCHYGMCAFCNQENEYRHNYRTKSVSKVVNDLLFLYKNSKMRYFQIVDEAIEPDYFFDLINEMDKHMEFKDCKWFCYSRISMRYTEEILLKARRNGLEMMMFGVETFNNRLLKFVKKGITAEAALHIIHLCAKCKIKTFIWLLCNFPSETVEEIENDIQTVKDNIDAVSNFTVAKFFLDKKCDMYKHMSDYNILVIGTNGWNFISHNNGEIIDHQKTDKAFMDYVAFQKENFITNSRYFTFFS